MGFKEIKPDEIAENFIKNIRDEWMLISVGDEKTHNMMTASWGFVGEMWGKDTAIAAIRNTRYTYKLIENLDTFALCFMGERKDIHKICGSESGRDTDKVAKTGLTPVYSDGTMYFKEARLVLICKKVYAQAIDAGCFINKDFDEKWYNGDYHTMYYGEIIKAFENK